MLQLRRFSFVHDSWRDSHIGILWRDAPGFLTDSSDNPHRTRHFTQPASVTHPPPPTSGGMLTGMPTGMLTGMPTGMLSIPRREAGRRLTQMKSD